jgi:hypothetical protein
MFLDCLAQNVTELRYPVLKIEVISIHHTSCDMSEWSILS